MVGNEIAKEGRDGMSSAAAESSCSLPVNRERPVSAVILLMRCEGGGDILSDGSGGVLADSDPRLNS